MHDAMLIADVLQDAKVLYVFNEDTGEFEEKVVAEMGAVEVGLVLANTGISALLGGIVGDILSPAGSKVSAVGGVIASIGFFVLFKSIFLEGLNRNFNEQPLFGGIKWRDERHWDG